MDLCDRNDIQALLARHGFRFAKSLGQNFLIRGDVAEDIAAAGCVSGCGVLEVGPGIGALAGGEGGVGGAGQAAAAGAGGDAGGL